MVWQGGLSGIAGAAAAVLIAAGFALANRPGERASDTQAAAGR